MARRDPVARAIFNERGILRAADEEVEAFRDLWLLYHFYVSAVSNSAQLAGSPEDVFKIGGLAN